MLGKRFPDEVAIANELAALREQIKAAPVKAKATKASIQKIAREADAMTCQCCGRSIYANTGRIAHHGYERPGDGWQTASCYREALTWSLPGGRSGHDAFREHADAVIADLRRAVRDGGFYNHPALRMEANK